ncbi:D-alanine--D-alanine ligase [Rickettsiales bacterium]|nr:D-alanine--D-alanine ligase [Rickettsiales bacterium]
MIKKSDLIIVLYGGHNAESEVSKMTGENVFLSLIDMGYNAQKLFFDDNFIQNIQELQPKLVFNALHGKFGEDGRIQSILDFLKIPYTHSDSTASAIAMNKVLTSYICTNQIKNLHDPKTIIIHKNNPKEAQEIINNFPKPFILKPIDEGSSAGVKIIKNNFDINNYHWEFDDKMIIQEYIKGVELQVAIMDDKPLGICEIIPKGEFFDYDSKYGGKTKYIIPARIDKTQYQEILSISLKCHQLLNCRGINRIELILSQDKIYFLEMNTQPGFARDSLVPKIAKEVDISFDQIVEYLINNAQFND